MSFHTSSCRDPTASFHAPQVEIVPTLCFQHNPYSFDTSCRMVYVISPRLISPATDSMSLPTTPTTAASPGNLSMTTNQGSDFPLAPVFQQMVLAAPAPTGTLHTTLSASQVPFVPYPSVAAAIAVGLGANDAMTMMSPETPPSAFGDRAVTTQFCDADYEALLREDQEDHFMDAELELAQRKRDGHRLFLGQLPLYVTPQQVEWTVETVTGCTVFGTEAIHTWGGGAGTKPGRNKHKRGQRQQQQPKGCVHTYCDTEEEAERIVDLLGARHRVLVDDTGIFVATTETEQKSLFAYCGTMAADVQKRFPMRPFRPVVAQRATSTFVPVAVPPAVAVVAASDGSTAAAVAVQAPPPYYSCAVERLRQEATLPPYQVQQQQQQMAVPQWTEEVFDPTMPPLPSFRRQRYVA